MSLVHDRTEINVAPGSVVVVRDEEWLVTGVEPTNDGQLLRCQGLTELVRDTTASFYESLDDIEVLDPARATVLADDSPHYRRSRLWLEAALRKTAAPLDGAALTVSTGMLADPLSYQLTAVRKALDPANLRTRILLADAVGLGKTLEIGMILAELIRRGRGERILIVTPRHVLEQMQNEMWCRFAIPFVRLDSLGIQRVRQKLPATRNPFTYFKRVIISIDTLKMDTYLNSLRQHRWDAVVIDESHNVTNSSTLNNRLARILAINTDALILASATPHNGKPESFAELVRLLEPTAVQPGGDVIENEVKRLIVRRQRQSPEVASVVGADWAERKPPQNWLVPASDAENDVAVRTRLGSGCIRRPGSRRIRRPGHRCSPGHWPRLSCPPQPPCWRRSGSASAVSAPIPPRRSSRRSTRCAAWSSSPPRPTTGPQPSTPAWKVICATSVLDREARCGRWSSPSGSPP